MRDLLLTIFMFLATALWAAETDVPAEEQEFVSSYLIVVDPSPKISSAAGHAALRMVCPEYDMDFCFSVLSDVPEEDMNRLFVTGKLKAGMIAIPTSQFTERYQAEGRGVCQYKLLLSDEVKRELWRALDNDVERGQTIPFDPMGWNCTSRIQLMLEQALDTDVIEYQDMSKLMGHTFHDVVADYDCANSWAKLFTMTITGFDADIVLPMHDQIFIPTYMAEALQYATINGQPVLSKDAEWLVPSTGKPEPLFPSTSLVLLILAVLCLLSWRFCMGAWLALGLCITYLWLGTDLPHMSWTWLLLLFNPLLPLVFLTRRGSLWRKLVAASVALVICVSIFWPHTLMAPEYLMLTSVFALRTIFTPFKPHRTMNHSFSHRLLLLAMAFMASVASVASDIVMLDSHPELENRLGTKWATTKGTPNALLSSGKDKIYFVKENNRRIMTNIKLSAPSSPTGYENGHGYVDLGLPSGTMWAADNLGSTPSSSSTITTYWFGSNKPYGTPNQKYEPRQTALNQNTDAASYNWKGTWHMPTLSDIQEVGSYCTFREGSYNDVYGIMVTGPNGNSIFLPAATDQQEGGASLIYWTSTMDTGAIASLRSYCFFLSRESYHALAYGLRLSNLPTMIRPVCRGKNSTSTSSTKSTPSTASATTNTTTKSTTKSTGHGYIDLGLPSGTLWATENITSSGKSSYLAWGETSVKSTYSPSNYNVPRAITTANDAASVMWSADWCMPTRAQFQELIDRCKWELRTLSDGSKCYNVIGPNGAYITLPLEGAKQNNGSNNGIVFKNQAGYYYCSTTPGPGQADYLMLFTDSKAFGNVDPYVGRCIRPVRKK